VDERIGDRSLGLFRRFVTDFWGPFVEGVVRSENDLIRGREQWNGEPRRPYRGSSSHRALLSRMRDFCCEGISTLIGTRAVTAFQKNPRLNRRQKPAADHPALDGWGRQTHGTPKIRCRFFAVAARGFRVNRGRVTGERKRCRVAAGSAQRVSFEVYFGSTLLGEIDCYRRTFIRRS
jgi:hypothetical protein